MATAFLMAQKVHLGQCYKAAMLTPVLKQRRELADKFNGAATIILRDGTKKTNKAGHTFAVIHEDDTNSELIAQWLHAVQVAQEGEDIAIAYLSIVSPRCGTVDDLRNYLSDKFQAAPMAKEIYKYQRSLPLEEAILRLPPHLQSRAMKLHERIEEYVIYYLLG